MTVPQDVMDLTFSPAQWAFWNATERYVDFEGAVRAGKTTPALLKAIDSCQLTPQAPAFRVAPQFVVVTKQGSTTAPVLVDGFEAVYVWDAKRSKGTTNAPETVPRSLAQRPSIVTTRLPATFFINVVCEPFAASKPPRGARRARVENGGHHAAGFECFARLSTRTPAATDTAPKARSTNRDVGSRRPQR
jgi:hypothetical protein